ncbi:DNA polymerase alpha catalytic subunit isoform X1 [Lycium barbarum]|uniref:DNA polymerase alpha catalytic subunit isoform X1 n=1 Tax=Lycium barbarum TaxID=112863 RepID=UPI00293E38EE|nr:DNA polymerase alpha catalytic subunit isoform X1 [Lycium barbarum]
MSSDEQPTVVEGRRSSRKPTVSKRAEALERIKALRTGNRRSTDSTGFQIKIDEPIYDIVEDDEYDDIVAKRREASKGFIVDDDGLGYGDEGQEEDWSVAGVLSSEEGSGDEDERPKNKRKASEKKQQITKKPSAALTAAAALMGKQRISSMFTSSVFKRDDKTTRNLSCDSIVDDVIAEFAPDEADRERRRRGNSNSNSLHASRSSIANSNSFTVKTEKAVADNNLDFMVRQEVKSVIVENSESIFSGLPKISINEGNDSANDYQNSEVLDADVETRDNDAVVNCAEAKLEPLVESKVFALNAKIKEEKDSGLSATAEWQALRNAGSGVSNCNESGAKLDEDKTDFELDSDGSLPFFILDAHEELYGPNAGNIYLFGKVKVGGTYDSCCIVVKNMQRCVYAVPNGSVFCTDIISKLSRDVEESQISPSAFLSQLHEMASGLKAEFRNKLLEHNISSFSMSPVKRNYAFERSDVPRGENFVLKINYPFKDPPLPSDLRGENFSALLGTHSSAMELFLIKRKIKGPSWLSIMKFSSCPNAQRVSWCKFEVIVDSPKDIQISTSSKNIAEIPPVVVTAINLKTIINEKQNINEIVSASVICCQSAKIDTPMLTSEWTKPGMLSHFTVVRKLEGGIFPMGFTKETAERNAKAGSNVIISESSERALLNRLMLELHKLDSDVLIGHNISGFDLDVLLHRVQACKVPSIMWSRIGRLKRSVMPKLTKGSTIFGSGASPGIMSCIAGRLLCDTFLSSRELLKEVSYSLTQLAKNQLNKDRKEISPHDVPRMFQAADSLVELIECGETDAWLSMELMFHLSVLPLTRQLTNISGNLWGKTLQGARAQRVEYLLLHAFHAKKFIVPDKYSSHAKEAKITKRKLNHGDEGKETDPLDADDPNVESGIPDVDHGKTKKGPSYSGGLVLEPKRGLYDKYILLLDFNSLYPSIIQEFNICFTTVERSLDGSVPRLPSSKRTGLLPELLKNLVERRRMVKSWLKTASGLKAQQFDIQQQALKLTANSMYGCLGFSNSRFYAKSLAELITSQGREILQSTVDLVQTSLNLEVIYGDTDSIMIYSGLDDIGKSKAIAAKVIQEVNKKYRCLEIDLDGLYKRMLLLKKKKYAAVKVQFKDGRPYEVIEKKGLDMVRRDWSLLSKELGDFCLSQILSGGSCEDVVESIHNALMKVQEEMRNGQIELEKYVITKSLTKPPEAYPDAKSQPHVEVALRLKRSGYVTGCSAGDTVPYVICCEQGNGSSTSVGIAQRARHPDELKKDNGNWMVDIDYYLAQQIHPVISRLCASIQGTSPARLADCLGLDSSKFQNKSSEAVNDDPSNLLLCAADDEERYRGCEPLTLTCPSCSGSFECAPIFSSICSSISQKPVDLQVEGAASKDWERFSCPKCPEENGGNISSALIANQVKRQVEGFISTYYKGVMMCDDETCNYTTRSLNLRVIGDSERGTVCPNYPRCNGHLLRQYTEADLYRQLAYFCYVLDTVRCIDKVESNMRIQVEKELARIRPVVEAAASTVQKFRDRCAYGWVQLKDLTVSF